MEGYMATSGNVALREDAPKRQSQVSEQLESLEKVSEALSSTLTRLEERLGAVLCPRPMTGEGARQKDGGLCPLADTLRCVHGRLEECYGRADMLLKSIEL